MIDNLTEAIAHERKEAEAFTETSNALYEDYYQVSLNCQERANYHEQLASWLEELAERREADRWISVKEKLPELHNSVVATDNNDVFVAWYDEGWNSSDSQFDKHTPIVAWRPIPQYTESEKGGAE